MFDAEQLKVLAARAVSMYISKGVPLTDAVAALSKETSLNTDQTKRLVEAVNQVAYLKILETAKDRTFNFPVANYEEVIAKVTTPDGAMDKEASSNATSPFDIINSYGAEDMEKAASYEPPSVSEFVKSASEQEILGYLPKVVFSIKAELEKIAYDKLTQVDLLMSAVDAVRADPFSGYKMQKFAGANPELAILIGIDLEKVASERSPTFVDKDFDKIALVDSLYKEAKEMLGREEFLICELEKVAFLPVLAGVARAAGSIFGRAATSISAAGSGSRVAAVGGRVGRAADLAMGAKSLSPKSEASGAMRKGYTSMTKASALWSLTSGASGPASGPVPRTQSTIDNISDKWKKGRIHKTFGGKSFTQKLSGVGTLMDYHAVVPMIRPKDSVWDALHNRGGN